MIATSIRGFFRCEMKRGEFDTELTPFDNMKIRERIQVKHPAGIRLDRLLAHFTTARVM